MPYIWEDTDPSTRPILTEVVLVFLSRLWKMTEKYNKLPIMTTHPPKLIIYIYPNLQVTFSITESCFMVLEYSEYLAFCV